ncbi:MAG: hypothetical protein WCL23_02815 [Candidatus Moraniibacteriota bacterium]
MNEKGLYELSSRHYPPKFDASTIHLGAVVLDRGDNGFPDEGTGMKEVPVLSKPIRKIFAERADTAIGAGLKRGIEYSGDDGSRESEAAPFSYPEISREAVQNFLGCLPAQEEGREIEIKDVVFLKQEIREKLEALILALRMAEHDETGREQE